MLKEVLFFISNRFCFRSIWAQDNNRLYHSRKITVSDTPLVIDSVSINKEFFKLTDQAGTEIDTSFYQVDFQKGTLSFKNNFQSSDTLTVQYLKLPQYLTKKYSIYDQSRVVSNEAGQNLYQVSREPITNLPPFCTDRPLREVSRGGVTVGNNQNTVVNSNLDLEITGKVSEKVSLRASLQEQQHSVTGRRLFAEIRRIRSDFRRTVLRQMEHPRR